MDWTSKRDLPGEEWRDVYGYEGLYKVSNKGRMKSFMRRTPVIMTRVLCNAGTGYWQVRLTKEKKATTYFIHRLVMMAFQPIDNHAEMEVNHKSFDTLDASLENLEWVTPKQNIRHHLERFDKPGSTQAGARPMRDTRFGKDQHIRGEACFLAKLNAHQVMEMRRMAAEQSINLKELAKQFGVHVETARGIVTGRTWKHLLPEAAQVPKGTLPEMPLM